MTKDRWYKPILDAIAKKAADAILEFPINDKTADQVADLIVDAKFQDVPLKSLPSPARARPRVRSPCPYPNCDFVGVNRAGLARHMAAHRSAGDELSPPR